MWLLKQQSTCREKNFEANFFWEKFPCLIFFGFSEGHFCTFGKDFSAGLPNLKLSFQRNKLTELKFFEFFSKIRVHFVLCAKFYRALWNCFQEFCLHWLLRFQRITSRNNTFFENNLYFTIFPGLSLNIIKSAFICPKENFSFEKKRWLLQFSFGNWAKIIPTCAECFLPGYSKQHYTCPENQFEENQTFWENISVKIISDIEQNFFWLSGGKVSAVLSKLHLPDV